MTPKTLLKAIPRWTLAHHLIVSDQSRYIYTPTPLVASRSVTLALLRDASGNPTLKPEKLHQKARKMFSKPARDVAQAILDQSYTRFCVVRHPVERFLSAYQNKMSHARFRRPILDFIGEADDREISLEEFFEVVAAQEDQDRDRHWRSQVGVLYPDVIEYDHVLRLETLASDWQALSKKINIDCPLHALNKRQAASVAIKPDLAFQHRVAGLFKEDMDRYGYDVGNAVNASSLDDSHASEAAPSNTLKPNFLFVGLGKTGSSLTHHVIQRHPDVFLSRKRKELNFFSLDANYERGPSFYESMFKGYDGEIALGDITPAYYSRNRNIKRIVDFYGGQLPKIILSVRHPITHLYSRYVQVLKVGKYLKTNDVPRSFAWEYDRGKIFFDAYKQIQQVLKRLGGPENILLLVYEKDFAGDYGFERKIYDFLGLNSTQRFYDPQIDSGVNSGLLPRIIAAKSEDWLLEVDQRRYAIPANRAFFCSTNGRSRMFTPEDREFHTISEFSGRQAEWMEAIDAETQALITETQLKPIRALLESKFDVDLSVWDRVEVPTYTMANPPEDLLLKADQDA